MSFRPDQKRAGFWVRVSAGTIDWLCVFLIAFPFYYFIDKRFFNGIGLLADQPAGFGALDLVTILVFFYNMVYLTGEKCQSWGKSLFKIKVIGGKGEPVGFWHALFRIFFAGLFSVPGFLWIICDKEKQAWHDHIIKTYVVHC